MMVSTEPKRWPPGRQPLPQRFIDGFRIERCARAIADLAHEVGPHAVTTAMVTKRVKMSRATFYELFDGRAGALRCACEVAQGALLEPVEAATADPGAPEERLEAVIRALLEAIREEPRLAELCLVHSASLPSGGPNGLVLAEALAAILRVLPEMSDRLPVRAELAAHGLVSVIARRLWAGEADRLGELCDELTAFVSASCLEPARA
jgi:AcrR family transcriptional regulator